MDIKKIPATDLPKISGLIKDVVNMGMWFLYEIQYTPNPNAKYALSTNKGEYLLDETDDVISAIPKEGVRYISQITFTGIPEAPTVNVPTI